MTLRPRMTAGLGRLEKKVRQAPKKADTDGSTPYQQLLRSAEQGQFESMVRKARPAQPVAMVTPEEREAELRAEGKWPADKPEPKPAPKKPLPAEPPRALSPNEQYIEEKCHWRQRGPNDWREPIPYGRCKTEYDVLTGEPIGDGYDHSGEEDDEW